MNDQELAHQLTQFKHQPVQAPDYLAAKIVASIPQRAPIDQLYDFLTAALWRPLVTVALPLIVGFTLGLDGGDISDREPQIWHEAESLVFAESYEDYTYDEI